MNSTINILSILTIIILFTLFILQYNNLYFLEKLIIILSIICQIILLYLNNNDIQNFSKKDKTYNIDNINNKNIKDNKNNNTNKNSELQNNKIVKQQIYLYIDYFLWLLLISSPFYPSLYLRYILLLTIIILGICCIFNKNKCILTNNVWSNSTIYGYIIVLVVLIFSILNTLFIV
mgnify:CR=1 FL=1